MTKREKDIEELKDYLEVDYDTYEEYADYQRFIFNELKKVAKIFQKYEALAKVSLF